ncbi:MAG: type IV pili twitching motility protein PilT, partial [Syntrophomonadaceae bacterium]|nr:type IV pili twitching motility protein PilT [Syntrophomonadaceae bacterium]
MQLDLILKTAVDKGASDVHLSPDIAPIIRFNTRLEKLDAAAFSQRAMEQMALYVLGPENYKIFAGRGEIDTSYHIDGVGNFRVNIYRHRSMIAIAARIIKTEIPTLEY